MRKLATTLRWMLAALVLMTTASLVNAQTMIWNEDFEVDGAGTSYTLSTTDGLNFVSGPDFFTQVPSGTIPANYEVSGQNNTGYFAGVDVDAGGTPPMSITFDDVDISTYSNLELRILLAEDDDGGNQDWDSSDLFYVEVDIDNSGTFTKILQIANDGSTFNSAPGRDTNLDGVYDPGTEGPEVTSTFAEFAASISGSGSLIDIRLVYDGLTSNDEDLALDFVQIWEGVSASVPGCMDGTACNFDASATMDDGSCFFPGDTCDDGDASTANDLVQGDCSCAGTPICSPAPMWTPVEVVTNNGFNANGAWEVITDGFSVNGFCGGGCVEAVDTWIVSNGLDFSSVVASDLVFDASESFGVTDLDLQYTTSYSGDPAAASWTSLQVFTDAGTYSVDLSSLAGLSEVYFGFQYLDDGVDGYSGWEVTNIEIAGDCPSAIVAFDCPVEMANIGDACDDGDANTTGDVIQPDCSCAGTPAPANSCTLFFSEYAEGSGNNKYFEIFNPTDAAISLDGYAFPNVSNAPTTVGEYESWNTFPSGATIAAGDVYVVAHGSADPLILAEADHTFNSLSNGDDGFALVEGTEMSYVIVDWLGNWDGDPGSGWAVAGVNNATQDVVLVRKSAINSGNDDWLASAGTDANDSEWIVEANEDWSDLGMHTFTGTCGAPVFDCPVEMANIGDACDDGDANTTGDVIQPDCSCVGTPVATTPDLIITEIHYNGDDGSGFPDNQYEFLEIYNNEATAVVLDNYTIGGVTFTFPIGSSIAAGEYIIVAVNAPFYTGNGYQVFEWGSGALSNGGETVSIFDDLGNLVDEVSYDENSPWPTSADGGGPSLELSDLTLDNNDPANWQASCDVNGTPGAVNTTLPCGTATATTINAVQSNVDANGGSLDAGSTVEISGIVTGVYSSLFTMQDGTGAFSGIWVDGTGVAQGDQVTVVGDVTEPNDLTLITNTVITVNSSGNALPATELLGTAAINDEQWEGVLVETTGVVDNGDAGFGEWSFDDASGPLLVDDLNGNPITPVNVGDQYTVIAPVYYSFGDFKLAPRDNASDILLWGCTDNTFPNYDAEAAIDDGSCADILGCTNPDADNFDPAATNDDGSCIISGCTDNTALNYNVDANNDDGSCYFTLPNLVINEIHYNPCTAQGDDGIYEFLEIYNAEMTSVDLEGFTFTDGIVFTFPAGATMAAGEYIIIAITPATYTGNGYQVFTPESGVFGNGGELVQLSDGFGNVIDEVTYDDGGLWPSEPDGDCPSLELIDPALDNSDPANWQPSFDDNGTPGAVNSTPPPSTNYTISEIQSDVDGSGGSNKVGENVTTNGVVTAVYPGANLFTIQDGTGPWSGIWVSGSGVALGDEVDVTGTVIEDFGLTLISPASNISVLTSGNPLPAVEVSLTNEINDEQWEGVLLQVTGEVTNGDVGFGEWLVDDGTGGALVDDLGILLAPVDEGVTYRVTGPNYYSFGDWKLQPRDLNDAERFGCTDNSFPNFDPAATVDDGSCGNIPGCTDADADNFDPAATVDDGSCVFSGCTDNTALNYDAQATIDDGSCYFTLPNLVINEIHYNPCPLQGEDFDFEFIELYNADAVTVELEGFTFAAGFDFTFPAGASIAAGEYIVIAVTAATYSGNGYQVFEIQTGNLSNGGETIQLEDGFSNIIDVVSYGDVAPWPIEADGFCASLELIDPALDNADGNNWQASIVSNGTPGAANSEIVQGCTDPTACNYDATANEDDGTCDFTSCVGCTYSDANNYNPSATQDDGSCDFTDSCPADIDNDGIIATGDLLEVLNQFGQACP